jgi:xylan 1,4-beta-xylosidase
MRLAQQCAPVIQVVIGRDVPPWLWQPTEVLAKAGPPAIPWKPGHLLPPSDYAAYEEIVYQLARHIREELGLRVHSYLIWGGADARGYFRGTMDDYCRVYETCARAIKRADPDAQVGGPSPDPLFDPDWPRALIEFCGRGGVPLDFVSLHNYSLYPDQSRLAAEWTRRELERYPELRSAEVHFDEWNSGFGFGDVLMGFKRGPMNAAYAAATFIEMAEGGVAYACYACPEEGWGLFGVPLEEKDGTPRAIYNAYRLFSRLEGRRCGVAVSEPESGLRALAATTGGRLQVILCGYGAEQQPAETPLPVAVQVEVAGVSGLDGDRTAALWRVDATHANMLAGKDRAELAPPEAVSLRVEAGRADLSIAMSVPSVVLLEIGTG